MAGARHQPFFAYLTVYVPHQPATPAPADVASSARARAPRTPSFDEADVSRKPRFVRDPPPFTTAETSAIDDLYRMRIRSLQAVDRVVARAVRTLRATKQLDNTYIVFRRTTASTSVSTACRRASRRRTSPTSTSPCWFAGRACGRART